MLVMLQPSSRVPLLRANNQSVTGRLGNPIPAWNIVCSLAVLPGFGPVPWLRPRLSSH